VPYSSWAIKIIAIRGPSSRVRVALQGLVMRRNIRVRIQQYIYRPRRWLKVVAVVATGVFIGVGRRRGVEMETIETRAPLHAGCDKTSKDIFPCKTMNLVRVNWRKTGYSECILSQMDGQIDRKKKESEKQNVRVRARER